MAHWKKRSDFNISISADRAQLFLELYGNILLREKSAAFMKERASELIRVVTDEKGHLAKVFDFSQLKYRERDDLEFVFKFWRDEKKQYEVDKLWWGKTPIQPNGLSVPKWGYFSDIVTGPFFAFGQDSEQKDMLKTKNNIQVKTAQEIAEYNIKSLIHELYYRSLFAEPNPGENKNEKITEVDVTDADTSKATNATPPLPTPPDFFKIIHHPCDHTQTLQKKAAKLASKFHRIYLSNSMAHHVPVVVPLMKDDGILIVETARYMLDLTDEQIKAFFTKVMEMAEGAGLVRHKLKDEKDDVEHLVFVKRV
ncbi:Dynein assembly factor 3, axonemal [Rhizophlyctis rosea]|nr:Dynein assembly factor 3, axonemal [Rhizophlyctis rosea]